MDQYIEIDEEMIAQPPSNGNGLRDDGPSWSAPDLSLLGNGRRPAPAFPLSLMGSHWAELIERWAQGASAPVDYAASALLASAGALLANVRWPRAGATWTEPPVLWICNVGSPSTGKSPAMSAVFRPLQQVEDRMAADFEQTVAAYEMQRETAKAQREAWEAEVKAAIRDGGEPPIRPESAILPDEPVRPRVRVMDATVEKLGALSAALPRGLLLVRDELAGWLGAFDKYGGGGSDRAFAIEMYGGRPYTIDRMKNREPLHVRHLSIGAIGGIQPDKLAGVVDGLDDGLPARFLWVWPDTLPQFTLARDSADDSAAQDAFARLASLAMGSDTHGNPEPIVIRLARDAEDMLEEFSREMLSRAEDASGAFAGALGKVRGQALRLATILEFLWWSAQGGTEPEQITRQAMIAACGLLDGYFIPMAERVYGDAAIPMPERLAMALARHLKRARLREFNARTLRREIGGALREAAAMQTACTALVEAALIRENFTRRPGAAPGRAARNYEVNPVVFGSGCQ